MFTREARLATDFGFQSGAYFAFTMKFYNRPLFIYLMSALAGLMGLTFITGVCLMVYTGSVHAQQRLDPLEILWYITKKHFINISLCAYSCLRLFSHGDQSEFSAWNQALLSDLSFKRSWHELLSKSNGELYADIKNASAQFLRNDITMLQKIVGGRGNAQQFVEALNLQDICRAPSPPADRDCSTSSLLET